MEFLLYLANKSNFNKYKTSTIEIAKDNGFSQQTASRKLMELENEGFILRDPNVDGINIELTNKAKIRIRDLNSKLNKMVGKLDGIKNKIDGKVSKGLGEGGFYIGQKQYMSQLKEIFGFTPYKGTLNLVVDSNKRIEFLSTKKQFYINGFKTNERTFGGLKAYPCLIYIHKNHIHKNYIHKKELRELEKGSKINDSKINGAILVPDRTNHNLSVLEVIAPYYLRDKLNLNDGDVICLE